MSRFTFAAVALTAFAAQAFPVDPAQTAIVSEGNKEATEELKAHLDLLLGADVKVVPAADAAVLAAGTYVWRVKAPTREEIAREECAWDVTEEGAEFRGARRHAVCRYFENAMGVRYPWGAEIAWRGSRPADFVPAHGEWAPTLRLRNMRAKGDGLVWRWRLADGAHDRPVYGHAFTKYWERFAKVKPQFFAMRADGKRLPVDAPDDVTNRTVKTALNPKEAKHIDHVGMCVSNEELAEQLVADWREAGAPPYLNACENDTPGADVCKCPACLALDEPKPADAADWWPNWHADRYVVFARRVLALARKTRPDVQVVMYAYNGTEAPPRRERLVDGIIIGLVPTYFGKDAFAHYLAGWKAAGMKSFFCRSNRRVYFNPAYTPVGWERHFFDLCIVAQKEGCLGFDYDGSAPKRRCAAGWLSDYVTHKAMCHPDRSFDYWMDHYCAAFGAAAADVKEYFRLWREEVFEKRIAPDFMELSVKGKFFNFTRGLFWNLGAYYRADDYDRALAVLDRALARPGLSLEDRARVEELRFTTEHARLIFDAVVHKGEAKLPFTKALHDFRKKNDMQMLPWYEDRFGDITGIKAYMDASR